MALGRIFELLVLLGRSREAKELEILVLRHELRVLGRGGRRVRYQAHDRALLAALSRLLLWVPETRLRCDVVLVDEPAEQVAALDSGGILAHNTQWLSGRRWVHAERSVRPVAVVMLHIDS